MASQCFLEIINNSTWKARIIFFEMKYQTFLFLEFSYLVGWFDSFSYHTFLDCTLGLRRFFINGVNTCFQSCLAGHAFHEKKNNNNKNLWLNFPPCNGFLHLSIKEKHVYNFELCNSLFHGNKIFILSQSEFPHPTLSWTCCQTCHQEMGEKHGKEFSRVRRLGAEEKKEEQTPKFQLISYRY